MTWYRFTLTKDAIARGAIDRAMGVFSALFMNAGGPHDLALFGAADGTGEYFVAATEAPGVEEFLVQHEAVACAVPVGRQLALVVGNQRAWDLVGGPPKYPGT